MGVSTLVLVDGPNLYNDVDRWLTANAADPLQKDYLAQWFDFDRVIRAALRSSLSESIDDYGRDGLGAVVFHSDKPLGRSSSRLTAEQTSAFWGRQSLSDGTSTVLVTVPGHQPERMAASCPKCAHDVTVESKSEKGVDTSMVTYLFETSDHWRDLVLFTNDADFVPPVQALRRRGKRVFVAAIDTAGTSALKRSAQRFIPIPTQFLASDLAVFKFVQPGGGLDDVVKMVESKIAPPQDAFWVAADGASCPMLVFQGTNEEREKLITAEVRKHTNIVWFDSSSEGFQGRHGRMFYTPTFSLGEPVARYRDAVATAHWQLYWSDSPHRRERL